MLILDAFTLFDSLKGKFYVLSIFREKNFQGFEILKFLFSLILKKVPLSLNQYPE